MDLTDVCVREDREIEKRTRVRRCGALFIKSEHVVIGVKLFIINNNN